MKILMLCGYFAKANEEEVIRHSRSAVQFSANLFQQKLIGGLRALGQELYVISAPFIGSFPNESDVRTFRGFEEPQEECRYVGFNNIWGLRNFSRAAQLKKAVRFFIDDPCEQKMIVVYCPHTPFLEAAAYAKKKDPRIRICFYVPDLPNYMNLNANRSALYDFAKSFDIAKMNRLMCAVDSYVLLTGQMRSALRVDGKPCLVAEGIMESVCAGPLPGNGGDGLKYVVYTGKLNEKFGVKDLIDGFRLIGDPDYRLVLCGTGDCIDHARAEAEKDPRIIVTGQILPQEAGAWQRRAAVLVNPRPNNEEYTKYSFPSKIIEYLLTGKPVAACLLDGMPRCYGDFLYVIDDSGSNAEAIRAAIERGIAAEDQEERYQRFLRYAADHLCAEQIARKMVEMTF